MSQDTFYADRAATFQHFYSTGCTLGEIGSAWGISGERVRQVLEKYGRPDAPERIDPLRALSVARKATGITQAAKLLGTTIETLRECLRELGILPALERLWRMRSPYLLHSRCSLLRTLTAIARDIGRTPTVVEFRDRAAVDTATVAYHFGSWKKAVVAAGLTPNKVGRPKACQDSGRVWE